jgi:hypothetical protein
MFPYDWYRDNTDYCDPPDPRDVIPAIPVLEPITVKPVELDALLWAEWKRIAERMP